LADFCPKQAEPGGDEEPTDQEGDGGGQGGADIGDGQGVVAAAQAHKEQQGYEIAQGEDEHRAVGFIFGVGRGMAQGIFSARV